MAVQTTSNLSNSVRTRYISMYLEGAMPERVYDNYATRIVGDFDQPIEQGSSVTIPVSSDLEPVTAAISETNDITPATMRDATVTISPASRGNAVQDSELLLTQVYTDRAGDRMSKLGKNMMESVELVAQGICTQGTNIRRAAARASLDAGTASNLTTLSTFSNAYSDILTLGVPPTMMNNRPQWFATMHPYAWDDLVETAPVLEVGQYQDKEILLGHELGQIKSFKLMVTPWAKTFWSAGADNGSNIATTLSNDENALDTSVVVASATNFTVGNWITIGTEETGNTHYATNERVQIAAISGTTITIIGSAGNGGLRFDHASGTAVRNADSVGTIVFGGPMSLGKIVHSGQELGPMGAIVEPYRTGTVRQWVVSGWKWYGGYGRYSQGRILRQEVAFGRDA